MTDTMRNNKHRQDGLNYSLSQDYALMRTLPQIGGSARRSSAPCESLSTTYRQMFVSRSARFLPSGSRVVFSGNFVVIATLS
jgi:hypothetical protein